MRLTPLALATVVVACSALPSPHQQRPLEVLVLYDIGEVPDATRYEHTSFLRLTNTPLVERRSPTR